MGNCKLENDFALSDCITVSKGGLIGKLYLIDFETWLNATKTRKDDGVNTTINSIAFTKAGDRAVEYTLPLNNITPTNEAVRNVGGYNGYKHNIVFFLPEITHERRLELHALYNFRKTVVIAPTASNEVCNVYGADAGLVLLSEMEAPADQNTGGGATVTLGTGETDLESLPCVTFRAVGDDDTSARAATLAALEELKKVKA